MSAKDYPITFPYGATDGQYYGTHGSIGPYHRGDDRAMPIGTPVVVNGVQIGLSGSTGASSGPHLHVGRFTMNGQDVSPQGGGFNFGSATVVTIASDSVNGNYVRLKADGYFWIYLHLSQQTCAVGQALSPAPQPTNTGGPEMITSTDQARKLYSILRPNGGGSDAEINGTVGHRSYEGFVNDAQAELVARDKALRDKEGWLVDMQKNINELNVIITNLNSNDQADKQAIADGLAKIAELTAQIASTHDNIMVIPSAPKIQNSPSLLVRFLALFIKKK